MFLGVPATFFFSLSPEKIQQDKPPYPAAALIDGDAIFPVRVKLKVHLGFSLNRGVSSLASSGAISRNLSGYTDLMVDGAPSPHQSDTTLRWLIDRLRS